MSYEGAEYKFYTKCFICLRSYSLLFLLALFENRQCHEPKCRVWQHINCVIIPEKPLDGVPPIIPSIFYCELCRIARGDPYVLFLTCTLITSIFCTLRIYTAFMSSNYLHLLPYPASNISRLVGVLVGP